MSVEIEREMGVRPLTWHLIRDARDTRDVGDDAIGLGEWWQ
jgi:hypothetical protein